MKQYIDEIKTPNSERCHDMWLFFKKNCSEAKGSSSNHQAWPGGYFDHIEDCMINATLLYETLSKTGKLEFELSDAMLVLFLHDIEKPIKYSALNLMYPDESQLIRDSLINKFKIELTDYQKDALKYIHGEGDDYSSRERVMNPLGAFCHCCDIISARIFFDKK